MAGPYTGEATCPGHVAVPPTKPPSSAHGLPPCRPLWLHGREARVPDPLEGRHDLPRHATPSPRSDLDQAGSTSPRSSKPSPLSVLPYKLEPQASTRAPRPLPASRARPTVDPPPPPPYSPIQAAHGLVHPIWQLPDPSPSALARRNCLERSPNFHWHRRDPPNDEPPSPAFLHTNQPIERKFLGLLKLSDPSATSFPHRNMNAGDQTRRRPPLSVEPPLRTTSARPKTTGR